MEHKLIQGGEQYLPFARSRIKALRATGLQYASQRFETDDAEISVRYALDQEYISISGGAGGWVAYPVYFDYRTSEINNIPATLSPLPPAPPVPPYPPYPPEPEYPQAPVGSPPDNPPYTYAGTALVVKYGDGQYFLYRGHRFFDWLEYHYPSRDWSIPDPKGFYTVSDIEAFNAEATSNHALELAFGAELRAYQAWHAVVWPKYLDAVEVIKQKYWLITVPAWIYSHTHITSTAVSNTTRVGEMSAARDAQIAVLRAELDSGALARYVASAVVPPPITPRVRLAAPFPIKLVDSDGAPYSGNYTFRYAVTDYTTDPHVVRFVDGSISGSAGASRLVMTNICATTELLEAVEALGGLYLRRDVVQALAAATGGAAGKYSFGCFASGHFTPGFAPFTPAKSAITLIVPPEYKSYIKLGTTVASVSEVIASDIYVMPKTALLIAHIEYQHFDRHTGRMQWVPRASAASFAPAYDPNDTGDLVGEIQAFDPFYRWGSPVAIRVRSVTRQIYGPDRTWSTPVISAPAFERTVLPGDNRDPRRFPDAIAILSKLPAQTVPPLQGGDLAYASVGKARLAGDDGLRDILSTSWSGDMSEATWLDRLVMEVLSITGTYKAPPP